MDNLDYIDTYFAGEFSPEESMRFEKRIQEDPSFAEEVSHYLGALAILKEANIEERKARFRDLYRQGNERDGASEEMAGKDWRGKAMVRKMNPWFAAGAAAAILAIVVLAWLYFQRPADTRGLADRFIRQNLTVLPLKMGARDRIQDGVKLFNDGRFPEALQQFEDLLRSDSLNPSALLDAGIVSLRMENYDRAVDYFIKLQNHTDPRISPALFYQALALMARNSSGDAAQAHQILQQIVQQNLNKKEDAQELLRKM